MYTNFELFNIETNRGLSDDLLLFRSYHPKWDVLACSLGFFFFESGCCIHGRKGSLSSARGLNSF
ncbi:hypothetical protein NC653_020666 [Populus alba x Populus x berolinensis]|uniref:Uncharacterized protein n=1 Tax=Populus alba x Populus x berolinensis TaxID=444605 RepID=A0AAD6MLB2_9ROSI|nr:hypothetical protein NC653_020666 [Populus alba x Populus x berolinensis]